MNSEAPKCISHDTGTKSHLLCAPQFTFKIVSMNARNLQRKPETWIRAEVEGIASCYLLQADSCRKLCFCCACHRASSRARPSFLQQIHLDLPITSFPPNQTVRSIINLTAQRRSSIASRFHDSTMLGHEDLMLWASAKYCSVLGENVPIAKEKASSAHHCNETGRSNTTFLSLFWCIFHHSPWSSLPHFDHLYPLFWPGL